MSPYNTIKSERYPLGLLQPLLPLDPNIAPVATRVRTRTRGNIRRTKSPRQDTLSRRSTSSRRVPKTRGDTNEFIRAFWVKGKPKCRKGYTYDFRRKMCRRI